MKAWSLGFHSFAPAQQRLVAHMIPETSENGDPAIHDALGRVADAINALAVAVAGVSAGPVQVYTSGNLAPGAAPFVSLTVLPAVPVAPASPIAAAPAASPPAPSTGH